MNHRSFAKKYMLNINDSISSLERDDTFKQTGLPKIKTPGVDLWDSVEYTRDRTEETFEDEFNMYQRNPLSQQSGARSKQYESYASNQRRL